MQKVAAYAFANWERLEGQTRLFHDALFASSLPDYCLDAISSTMSVLKTATCIRLSDGSFYGWEGLHSTTGSCEGTCTHVWNYAYALPFLYPALERTRPSAQAGFRFMMEQTSSTVVVSLGTSRMTSS